MGKTMPQTHARQILWPQMSDTPPFKGHAIPFDFIFLKTPVHLPITSCASARTDMRNSCYGDKDPSPPTEPCAIDVGSSA